jgi:hypothetical protein
MFHINFSPIGEENPVFDASVSGDVLTVNGQSVDFSPVGEGDTLPREAVPVDWLRSDVERINGDLHLTLRLPFADPAPQETRFPDPVSVSDGPVPHPPLRAVTVQEPEE